MFGHSPSSRVDWGAVAQMEQEVYGEVISPEAFARAFRLGRTPGQQAAIDSLMATLEAIDKALAGQVQASLGPPSLAELRLRQRRLHAYSLLKSLIEES